MRTERGMTGVCRCGRRDCRRPSLPRRRPRSRSPPRGAPQRAGRPCERPDQIDDLHVRDRPGVQPASQVRWSGGGVAPVPGLKFESLSCVRCRSVRNPLGRAANQELLGPLTPMGPRRAGTVERGLDVVNERLWHVVGPDDLEVRSLSVRPTSDARPRPGRRIGWTTCLRPASSATAATTTSPSRRASSPPKLTGWLWPPVARERPWWFQAPAGRRPVPRAPLNGLWYRRPQ